MVVLEKKNDFSIQNGIAGKKFISEVKQVFNQKIIQPEQDDFLYDWTIQKIPKTCMFRK